MITRVLVVDDASIFRRIISEALAGMPGVEVVGTASNGKLAVARVAELKPDLITLDIEMPEMNGLEVLRAIRDVSHETSAIMLSSRTVKGGEMTIRALEAGAFDFITKPEEGSPPENLAHLRNSLLPMVQALQRRKEIRSILKMTAAARTAPVAMKPLASLGPSNLTKGPTRSGPPIVLIGVSTGGPTALADLLPALPATIGAPVFIVQHMPPLFTDALAKRLQTKCTIKVKEAQDGETAQVDCVYIAPGGRHMKLSPGRGGDIIIRITDDPPKNACRPSVDILFRSVASHFPGRSIAVMLTGMGNDGTEGMRLLKSGGALTLAQDEASCVVFGMPKEAIQAGVVDSVVPLSKMAAAIIRGISETS